MERSKFLSEKNFENEQPLHLMYMKSFRVNKCEENCEKEFCINYHVGQIPRRRPVLYVDGSWNYSPKICKNPQPCKAGEKCKYAHTKEECSYHPLLYKVHECKYPSADKGKCSKWAFHCSFAHSEEDKRVKGLQQKKPSSFEWKSFKTEMCENLQCKIEDCVKFHDFMERRRNPDSFFYSVVPCNFVYKDFVFAAPGNCPNKDLCELAHTKNEVYYHKDLYKRFECKAAPCYSKICAFVHPGELWTDLEQEKVIQNIFEAKNQGFEEQKAENLANVCSETKEKKENHEILEEKKIEIPNKLVCKQCKEREIKWVFECGTLSCENCIGNICPLCNKKHITRIVI